jgi:hypothetical protein
MTHDNILYPACYGDLNVFNNQDFLVPNIITHLDKPLKKT